MNSIMDILNIPMGYILQFCYKIIPNYALALLLFTLIMKLVLLPLSIRQQKNSIKQAKLRPKEMAIRKRYAGRTDKVTQQKMQEEVMELYKKENYNPVGGCLPLFLQFPIIIALYNVIRSPLTYICDLSRDTIISIYAQLGGVETSAVNFGQIVQIDLITQMREHFSEITALLPEGFAESRLPSFTMFGGAINLADKPTLALNWLVLLPIVAFATTFLSMKITRKFTYQPPQQEGQDNVAASMKIMDFTMPLMTLWIAFTVPAILGLYWIYQNLLGMFQQIFLFKAFPVPQFTDEDYKAAEKEMNGSIRKESKNKQKVHSLHHIDDDEVRASEKETVEKTGIAPAALKEDRSGKVEQPTEKPKVRSLHHIDDEDYNNDNNKK